MKPDQSTRVSSPTAPRCGEAVTCPLSALGCGVCARVVAFADPDPTLRRLVALGMRPGVVCQVVRQGGATRPLHVVAGTVHLVVRADEARRVLVGIEGGPSGGMPAV